MIGVSNDFLRAVADLKRKKITMEEVLCRSGMSKSTFYRRKRELENMEQIHM